MSVPADCTSVLSGLLLRATTITPLPCCAAVVSAGAAHALRTGVTGLRAGLPAGQDVAAWSCPGSPPFPLSAPRLVLRAFTPDDADALLVSHGDPESVRYVPYPPRDRDAVVKVLERKVNSTALRADGDLLELAAELANGSVIGDLLVVLQSVEHGTVEVGYIFSPAHAGADTRPRRSGPTSPSTCWGRDASLPGSTFVTCRHGRCSRGSASDRRRCSSRTGCLRAS